MNSRDSLLNMLGLKIEGNMCCVYMCMYIMIIIVDGEFQNVRGYGRAWEKLEVE